MHVPAFVLLAAACVQGAAAATYTGNNCGSNAVTEIQAGAVSLLNDDVVIEYTPGPSPAPASMRVTADIASQPVVLVLCSEPPGPLSRCERIYADESPSQPNEHTYIVAEVAEYNAPACGDYRVDIVTE